MKSPKPTKEAVDLARKWLGFREAHDKIDHGLCNGREGYITWDCCPAHRDLRTHQEPLLEEMRRILPLDYSDSGTGCLASPRWWGILGFLILDEKGVPTLEEALR